MARGLGLAIVNALLGLGAGLVAAWILILRTAAYDLLARGLFPQIEGFIIEGGGFLSRVMAKGPMVRRIEKRGFKR